jgi:N-acetylneuraminic acid mutarotase
MRHRFAMTLVAGMALVAAACGDDDGNGGDGADGGGGGDGAGDDGGDDGSDGGGSAWETLADLPVGPVQETAAVSEGGVVYVLGGIGSLSGVLTYDVASAQWGAGPDLPLPVHHANAAVVDGTIYVVGALREDFSAIGVVWSWTPGDDAWAEHTPMSAGTERGASAVGAVDGIIVVAGGLRGSSVDTVSTYDPAADAWDDDAPPLPARIDHGTGQTVDGVFYAVGGRTDGQITGAVHAWVDGAWQERAEMPTARGGIGSGVVDGRIVVVGGEGNPDSDTGVFAQTEIYDPAADEWSAGPDMPTPRHGMGAAGVDGALYVPGGADVAGIGAVATHEVFRLP